MPQNFTRFVLLIFFPKLGTNEAHFISVLNFSPCSLFFFFHKPPLIPDLVEIIACLLKNEILLPFVSRMKSIP